MHTRFKDIVGTTWQLRSKRLTLNKLKILRNDNVRIIRDGKVVYEGKVNSLKRFKDDTKEVAAGFECGIDVENFNDIKVDDILESYKITEIKRKI